MFSGRRLRLLLGGSLFFAVAFGFPKDLSPPPQVVPGGFAAQQVTNTWNGGASYFELYLAQKGYIIFTCTPKGVGPVKIGN